MFGIGSGSSTIGITSAATNISNRIEGNSVSKTQYGIYSGGLSTVTKNTGNRINSNLLNTASPNNIAIGGILANFEDGIKIAHNNIGSIDKTALTGTAFGIALGLIPSNTVTTFTGSDVINADVSGNIINGITQMNSTGYSAFGIVLNTVASGTSLISNNMISQVRSAATPSDFSAGIVAGGGAGSTTQIYANSVAMTGTRGAATNPSYALAVGGSNPTIDIRNNILLNTQTSSSTGKSYAIGLAYSTYTALTSDNNDLFTSAAATLGQTGGLGTAGTDRTFATWLSTTGKDANSKNVDPQFKSTADIATSDLHLKRTPLSPSPVENFGVSIAANTGEAATYTTAENVTPATITVTRTGGSGNAGTVQYATSAAGGTTVGTCGSGGADYQQATGTLNFAAAETSKTFDIVICNDAVVETNEDVNITLSNATGSILGAQSTAVLTITNDDAASTNALLSDISLTNPTTAIAPPFAPGTAIYNASVANAVSSITVTGTAQDPNGSVSVNGGAFAVGSAFASVPLSVGANSVTVIGKAQGGTTQVSYTVNITRAVPAPTITSLNPPSGWTDTTVIIVGTNFTGATAVSFGGTPATTFTVQTDGFISATAPAHAAGVVDVSVTGPGGTSANSANDDFTYVTPDSAPEVNFTNPANGATGVLISQPVGVGFSENVSLAANAITLECPSGNMILQYPPSPMASVAGVTFYPTMPGTTTCTVTVDASKVNDVDANDPPDFMAANYVFSFTTETPTTVASLTRAHPNPTNLASVIWTIEFAAAVDGVSTSNFALVQGGGVTGASITSVNPQGTNPNTKWNISVNTGSSSGTLGLNFVNGTGVTPSVSTTLPYPGEVYDIDRDTPATPTITGSTPTSPNNSSTTPTINGTAEADSFVKVYTSNDCTTGLLAGNFATGVNFAIGVTVTANTTTTIYASATDAAGNVSGCTATPFSYTHDTVAPDTSISSSPPATTTSTSATFEFGGSDSFAGRSEKPDAPNAVGFTFECERDGGGFASCTSPKNYTGLSVGTHTFKVRATDPAGNTDATAAEFTWEIVTIPVQISVDTNAANETTPTVVTVTATADSAVSGNQTVTVAAAGTNITAGDYNFSSTTITIPDGGTTGSVTFTIVDDGVYEGSETAALTISNPSAGLTLGSPVGANVAITDNDTAPVISISNVSHNEGDSGTTTYIFDLTKTGATELNATGDFDTSGVTAIEGVCTNAGTDFLGLGGNFGFLPNETAKTFTISVCGDTTFEPDETFRIDLTNAANATYTGGAPAIFGTGTIVNDDSAATLGNYGDTPVALAGNATVTPSAPPANATNLVVSASTGYAGAFAGGLTINQTTGVVTVTDAHPAGTYTVTVNAFGDGSTATDTFVLTVSPGATCGQSSFDPAVNYTVGTNPNKVVTADVNLDGNPDMVVANGVSNNVSVLLGNGSGGFGTAANFAVGDHPNSIAVADLNLDGNPDIATANNQSANLSILFGNGSGVFGPATSVSAGNNPIGVVTADFNFDGKADLAAANSTDGNVSVFLGDGAGGFGAATNFGVGTNAIEVAVGDFNNDGNADVVTANNGSNNVSVLIGNGLGGFAAAANFSVGALPQSLAVGDINHDGKHDIVVTTTAALGASVLLGDGAGSFAAATSTDVGSNPTGVAISDVNLDGYPDLVVTNFTAPAPNVSVMLGNGAGAFGAQTLFGAGDNTRSVAAGDFNLDGKPDLAVANSGSGNVSVLLNVCAAPETDLTILKTDGGATVAAGAQLPIRWTTQTTARHRQPVLF
ncbi:MAG: VCBS repeat-containing protein [Chloracidobacterium sp.]|nr:VCBS repeat-containing protein [Chloracidobacterium sp.]